jgi:hypothetical protein
VALMRKPPTLRAQPAAKSTDRLRKKPYAHWYRTARWRRLAKHQVDVVEPMCRMCRSMGVITRATVCDHVEPHRGDEDAFWNGAKQSLCATCHLRKLNHEQYERRTGKKYAPRLGCDECGFPIGDHHWNREGDR